MIPSPDEYVKGFRPSDLRNSSSGKIVVESERMEEEERKRRVIDYGARADMGLCLFEDERSSPFSAR